MSVKTDVVAPGAGQAGLFRVIGPGLLDIRAHVIDSLKHFGGRSAGLYPDRPIYDIPALVVCGAR